MHDRLALQLQDDLTDRIVETAPRGVLIDISSLEMVDSFIGRMIGNIAAMARVLDAETVVVGMQPAVAITLVELGLSLHGRAHRAERREGHGAAAGTAVGRAADEGDCARHASTHVDHARTIRCVGRTSCACARRCASAAVGAGLQPGRPDQDRDRRQRAGAQHARLRRRRRGHLEQLAGRAGAGLRLTFDDQGPGIPDIELALHRRLHHRQRPGPRPRRREAARRTSSRSIESGRGHRVTITRWH